MTTKLSSAAKTDVGRKRDHNEDVFMVLPQQGLYLLADGMGGHASGQVASRLAATSVSQYICEIARQPGFRFEYKTNPALSFEANLLSCAVQYANERVYIQSCKDRSMEGMGTTITAIFNAPHAFILAHVGDSRIYRLRDGQLSQVSKDHSLLNHLIDTGEIRAEDASKFSNKNVILRAVGLKDTVDVEVKEVPRVQGDLYMMCSDGLSDLVSSAQITKTLSSSATLSDACDTLVGLANSAGGKDNITVVCVQIDQEVDASVSVPPTGGSQRTRAGQALSAASLSSSQMGHHSGVGSSPHVQAVSSSPQVQAVSSSPHVQGAGLGMRPAHAGFGVVAPPGPLFEAPIMGEPASMREHSVREPRPELPEHRELTVPKKSASMPAIPVSGKLKPAIGDFLVQESEDSLALEDAKAATNMAPGAKIEKEEDLLEESATKVLHVSNIKSSKGEVFKQVPAEQEEADEEQETKLHVRPLLLKPPALPHVEAGAVSASTESIPPKELLSAELILQAPPEPAEELLPGSNNSTIEEDRTQIELPVLTHELLAKMGDNEPPTVPAPITQTEQEPKASMGPPPRVPARISKARPGSMNAEPPSLLKPAQAAPPPSPGRVNAPAAPEPSKNDDDDSEDSIVIDPSLLQDYEKALSEENEEINSDEVTRRFNPFALWTKPKT